MQQPHAWPNSSGFNSVAPSGGVYGGGWAHTVPNLMPWGVCSPFGGDPCTSRTPTSWEMAQRNLKRKGVDLPEASPPKVCITEERMAARFREMHITPPPPKDLGQEDPLLNSSSSSDPLSSAKALVLAPEIKKLVEPEKIFAFFNKVERPSMALVVWQPQQQVFGTTPKGLLSEKEEAEDKPDEEMAAD